MYMYIIIAVFDNTPSALFVFSLSPVPYVMVMTRLTMSIPMVHIVLGAQVCPRGGGVTGFHRRCIGGYTR